MPTRRQLITGGAGGGVVLLTAIWAGRDDTDPSTPATAGDQTPTDTSDDGDDSDDEDGGNDEKDGKGGVGKGGDGSTDPTPKFSISADVDRRSVVRITHTIRVTVTIENVGDEPGKCKYHVKLYRDRTDRHQIEENGHVSLAPGKTKRVEHVFELERTGPHIVAVGKKAIDRFYVHPRESAAPDPWVGAGGEGEFDAGEERSADSET